MIKVLIETWANPLLDDFMSFKEEMPGCYPTGRYKFMDDTMFIEYTFNKRGLFRTKTKVAWVHENDISFETHSPIYHCDCYSSI